MFLSLILVNRNDSLIRKVINYSSYAGDENGGVFENATILVVVVTARGLSVVNFFAFHKTDIVSAVRLFEVFLALITEVLGVLHFCTLVDRLRRVIDYIVKKPNVSKIDLKIHFLGTRKISYRNLLVPVLQAVPT